MLYRVLLARQVICESRSLCSSAILNQSDKFKNVNIFINLVAYLEIHGRQKLRVTGVDSFVVVLGMTETVCKVVVV